MNLPHLWKTIQRPGTYIDLATYLLEHRTIFIGPEITSEVASVVTMQLLALSQEKGPIHLYLNCQGGSVPAGLAIVDMLDSINSDDVPVHTYCIGECIGIGCAVLISGRRGERKAYPSARISLFQEWYGVESIWGAEAQDPHERDRLMGVLKDIFMRRVGQEKLPPEELMGCFRELAFFSAEEAIKLDIVDKLVESREGRPSAGKGQEVEPA